MSFLRGMGALISNENARSVFATVTNHVSDFMASNRGEAVDEQIEQLSETRLKKMLKLDNYNIFACHSEATSSGPVFHAVYLPQSKSVWKAANEKEVRAFCAKLNTLSDLSEPSSGRLEALMRVVRKEPDWSAVHYAVACGILNYIVSMIQKDTELMLNFATVDGRFPLNIAAEMGQIESCVLIQDRDGFPPPANAQRLNMASFSSNELNYLVWRYLQESGFSHTAFLFRQECNLSESEIDSSGVAVGSLPNIVQKGLYYVEAELCSGATDDMEKALVASLSLLEAVNEKPVVHKVQLRTRQDPSSSQTQNNSDMSPKETQRERDRDARANSHNGVTKRDRQISPRNNGILGVHSKKQHAAQQAQASSVTNGDADKDNAKDELESIKFPKESMRFLKCHNSEVFICAWNPNSDLMASGSGDSTTRIWDLTGSEDPSTSDRKFESTTRILKHSALNGEQGKDPPTNKDVTSLDWNHTGDMLATGCYDGFARIWSRDGLLRCSLGAHKGPIFALKWSNNGDHILSAGVDKTTIVWDAKNGTQQQQFCFHSASALDVDWISDDMFASCSTDKTINVCQLSRPERPYRTYIGHNNEVNAVKYDSHSGRLASCSDDMTLRIWSLEDESPVHVWKAHQKEIYTIRWSPQGHILASASFDHTVRLWDVRRGEAVRSLTRHSDPVYSVSFSPDGRLLASGCFDRSVFIWDIHNGKLLQSYVGDKNQGGIFEVSWNFRGDKVAASASDGTVILMDVRHLKNKLV